MAQQDDSAPKKVTPKTVSPKRPKQAAAKKTAKSDAKKTEQPESTKKGPAPKKSQPKKRFKAENTATISGTFYRRAKERLSKSRARSFILLFVVLWIGIGASYYLWWHLSTKQTIINNVDRGIEAIQQNEVMTAESYLLEALDRYKTFHLDQAYIWYDRDADLFAAMLNAANGFWSIERSEKAMETLQSIALHNTKGPKSWVGEKTEQMMTTWVDNLPDDHNLLQSLYNDWVKIDPASWGLCGIHVVRGTEKISTRILTIAEQVVQSDFVIYGVPLEMSVDNRITVDGDTFYLLERMPGEIQLSIGSTVPVEEVERIRWYVEHGDPCLFFATTLNYQHTLTSEKDILLSEVRNVDRFNDAITTIPTPQEQ